MLNSNRQYVAHDRMRDLIDDNNQLLMVMGRFGIPLGFGDATVRETCQNEGVDCDTFLTVANYVTGRQYDISDVSLQSLIGYLERAHTYFLDFMLPIIRRKLIEAINCSDTHDVAFLILKFYDDYVNEVRRHMEFENKTVFEYARHLLRGQTPDPALIEEYSAHHDSLAEALNELKDLIIRHYSQRGNDLLTSTLYDIMNCEQDLLWHCDVEDRLFVPAVKAMEEGSLNTPRHADGDGGAETPVEEESALSQREKEIVTCVARGMSNKEIADELCLSVHTVTTHRRNITAKLQIHSPAGLVIYAILNGLVNLDDPRLKVNR